MGESRKSKTARREVWCSDEALVVRAMAAMTEPKCPGCGFALDGLEGVRCPECGCEIRLVVRSTGRKSESEQGSIGCGMLMLMYPLILISLWILGGNILTSDRVHVFGPLESIGLFCLVFGVFLFVSGIGSRATRFRRIGWRLAWKDYLCYLGRDIVVIAIFVLVVVLAVVRT